MAIPLLGSLGGLASTAVSACVGGTAFFCTSKAVSNARLEVCEHAS